MVKVFLAMVFVFNIISSGTERIFQTMATTLGLCGPLDLNPAQAATTDTFYHGGYMFGAIASVVIAKLLEPRTMITISVCVNLIGAIALVALGSVSMYGLYLCTA